MTDASFAADVERSPLPVLLDAWAPWCWPCQIIGPVVEEIAIEMAGRLRVGRSQRRRESVDNRALRDHQHPDLAAHRARTRDRSDQRSSDQGRDRAEDRADPS